jgi:D-alanine-D-alanine ligase
VIRAHKEGNDRQIAVIFGGKSDERNILIASGAQVFQALRGCGYEVVAVDTARGLLDPTEEQEFLDARIKLLPPNVDELVVVRFGASSLASSSDLENPHVSF